MNITCGTDIIEIDRIKKFVDDVKTDKALNKIYTDKEIEYCESKNNVKYQHYAARFAAKEAVFKAISNKLFDKFEVAWNDAQILNDVNGRPTVEFLNNRPKELEGIEISLSHCKDYAVANVVATWSK